MPFESLRALSRSTMLTALSPSKGMVEGRIERRTASGLASPDRQALP